MLELNKKGAQDYLGLNCFSVSSVYFVPATLSVQISTHRNVVKGGLLHQSISAHRGLFLNGCLVEIARAQCVLSTPQIITSSR